MTEREGEDKGGKKKKRNGSKIACCEHQSDKPIAENRGERGEPIDIVEGPAGNPARFSAAASSGETKEKRRKKEKGGGGNPGNRQSASFVCGARIGREGKKRKGRLYASVLAKPSTREERLESVLIFFGKRGKRGGKRLAVGAQVYLNSSLPSRTSRRRKNEEKKKRKRGFSKQFYITPARQMRGKKKKKRGVAFPFAW